MSRTTLLATLILVTVPLTSLAPTADAHQGQHPERISFHQEFTGKDTFQFSIRFERSQGDHFNIANGSFVRVSGLYGGNGTSGGSQHAAAMGGVVRYFSDTTCRDVNGFDPCFMDATGIPKKDVTETRVHEGAVTGFTFGTDPNWWAWGGTDARIEWQGADRFDIPPGEDQITIRIFVSVPGASHLDVDVHIHSPHQISMRDWTVNDGGFVHHGEDFEPTAQADTWPAEAMVDGRETITIDPSSSDRLYAGFGPSWFGDTQTFTGTALHNSAAVSDISFTHPNGNTRGGTAVAVGGGPQISVAGQNHAGDYVFDVDSHVGSGPQELYLIGWKGETV